MKFIFSILFILFSIFALNADTVYSATPDWRPVIGIDSPGKHVFFDKNSIDINNQDLKRISFAILLISSDKLVDLTIGDKTFRARSMVRFLAMDCSTGSIVPMGDYYYNIVLPKDKDIPIHIVNHTLDIKTIVNGSTSSPLYKTVCPKYI